MRRSLHDLWGSARGPVRRLAPPTRLVCGALALVAVFAWPLGEPCPSAMLGCLVGAWVLACGMPWRAARLALLLGIVPLLPYLLLAPLIAPEQGWERAVALPAWVLVRGVAATTVSLATVTTLGPSDLHEALVRLPVPALVSAIVLQIVQQSGTLWGETRQVAAAMAVRGASSGGWAALRVLASLPQVWLPRVLVRAERVAAAMELRGYADVRLSFGSARRGVWDAVALGLALAAVALAVGLRLGWSR